MMNSKIIQNLAKLEGLEPAERIAAATVIAYNGILLPINILYIINFNLI